MRVVIVAKTRMRHGVCIGGLVEDSARSVRIMPSGSYCNPSGTPFNVGDIWELDLKPKPGSKPPHVEDQEFTKKKKVGRIPNLGKWILSKVDPWEGGPDVLFDGKLYYRPGGTAFVSTTEVSHCSTGFWVLPAELEYDPFITVDTKKQRYSLAGAWTLILPFVGFQKPVSTIPAGTLVRLSLARPWTGPTAPPGEDQRHSLQLSGWY